jgi:hypothetical protein
MAIGTVCGHKNNTGHKQKSAPVHSQSHQKQPVKFHRHCRATPFISTNKNIF